MTEEPTETKTATDLALEQIRAEMDAMKAQYERTIKELQDANRGLWAAAHPAETPDDNPAPSAPAWDPVKAESAFWDALGRPKDKKE